MNYRDFLKNASKAYCQRVARRIGLTDRLPASKLRQQIVERFLDPSSLKDSVARLNSYERLVLMILAFSCGETGSSVPSIQSEGQSNEPRLVQQRH